MKTVRELKELGVGVLFELQDINTLSESGEVMLTVLAAFAQAESDNYRALAQMVYRRKFEAGIPVQHLERCFGYTVNAEGEYIPDPEEAPWVKRIFELYAEGHNCQQIARYLNEQGVKAAKGGDFRRTNVLHILENEIYKGDYIMCSGFPMAVFDLGKVERASESELLRIAEKEGYNLEKYKNNYRKW